MSGNTADRGGGIYNKDGSTLTNVTLSQSSAPFGANLYHSSGSATLKNSIVANPLSGNNCEGTPTSQGNNLEYPGTSCDFTKTGDKQNQDPLLGPLSNSGGPTRTHPLPWGSPAIDAGSNTACPSTDQRGVSRPRDGDDNGSVVCDIGVFEVDIEPPTVKSVTPGEGKKKVRRKTSITATFSEKMHPDTLTDSTVTLKNTKTGVLEPATITLSADGKKVTLDPPAKKLAKKTKYEVRIEGDAGGAEDLSGNTLVADKVWTFTTGRK